jgi:hypothetical protein
VGGNRAFSCFLTRTEGTVWQSIPEFLDQPSGGKGTHIERMSKVQWQF